MKLYFDPTIGECGDWVYAADPELPEWMSWEEQQALEDEWLAGIGWHDCRI